MNRLSPLAKGGVVGVFLVFLSSGTSFSQTDSLTPSYRLERASIIQCDFGASGRAEKMGSADQVEFRVGRGGDLYFVNYDFGKIWRFDEGGKLIRTVSMGSPLSRRTAGVALSLEGDLFVLDGRNKNLYRYDASLDLIGKFPIAVNEELEPIWGFAAMSWGDLLATGGLKSNIWKLQPEGPGFSAKPIYLPEAHRYSFLSEIGERRILATDPMGALMVLDRFGNLLKTFSFKKGLRAAALGRDYLATFWPYAEIMVLDSVGVVLGNWKTTELEPTLKHIIDFQVVQNKAYFLLPSLDKVWVFRLVRPDSGLSTGWKVND